MVLKVCSNHYYFLREGIILECVFFKNFTFKLFGKIFFFSNSSELCSMLARLAINSGMPLGKRLSIIQSREL